MPFCGWLPLHSCPTGPRALEHTSPRDYKRSHTVLRQSRLTEALLEVHLRFIGHYTLSSIFTTERERERETRTYVQIV